MPCTQCLTCLAVENPQGSKQCQLPVFPCIWTTMAHMCACGSPHPGKGMWEGVVRPPLLASNTNEPQLAQVTGHMSRANLETSNQQHGPSEEKQWWRLREKWFLVSTDILPRDSQAGKGCLSPQGRSSDSWEEKLPPVRLPPVTLLGLLKCLAHNRGSRPQEDAVPDKDSGEQHLSSVVDSHLLSGGPTPHFPEEQGSLSLLAPMGALVDISRAPGLWRILGWKQFLSAF